MGPPEREQRPAGDGPPFKDHLAGRGVEGNGTAAPDAGRRFAVWLCSKFLSAPGGCEDCITSTKHVVKDDGPDGFRVVVDHDPGCRNARGTGS
jgi:hypothetical protein